MCNNNGTCRKLAGGVMCPSYRVTRDEQHLDPRPGQHLRLAISGQLGPDGFTGDEMKETLDLCVSCKGCRRECPTGVDMARMKIEFLHHYHARHGLPLRERLVAELPAYAPAAARMRGVLNLRDRLPGAARLSERWPVSPPPHPAGLAQARTERPAPAGRCIGDGRDVVLFGDTFNRYFEPENLSAARVVLDRPATAATRSGATGRPLCCGRTYLAAGMVEKARPRPAAPSQALAPPVARGARVVGLEPSCLLTMRDEFGSLLPREEVAPLARAAFLLEEALADDFDQGRVPPFRAQAARVAHLHGHCHQKAFGVMGSVETVLRAVPGLEVRPIESSCCGMAGAFGYRAENMDISLAMGEAALFPAVRAAGRDDVIVADGTSCRHQIRDGTGREARHVVRVLADCLDLPETPARPQKGA
jgi:Fe-S oxidoreductase